MNELQTILTNSQKAKQALLSATSAQKNQALLAIADELKNQAQSIFEANQKDVKNATHLSDAMIDRLTISEAILQQMCLSLQQIAEFSDPIGEFSEIKKMPSGIEVGKMRTPIGFLGMIYESRPNVTIEAAGLAIKSSNAMVLRGGKEMFHSNQVLEKCIQNGLKSADITPFAIQVVKNSDRKLVDEMLQAEDYIDLMIPRGGKNLVQAVSQKAKMAVLYHLDGNCHVYVDAFADLKQARDIVLNAKTRRYGVCNALETLLIHQKVANEFLPQIAQELQNRGVELRGCERSRAIVSMQSASEQDWFVEYEDAILAIKVVKDVDEAIEHINHYGSHHTDAIVSGCYETTRKFTQLVDSSSVMVNASTAFADGFEYGLGGEIGISTNKIHAKGPVGLKGLTIEKYVVYGQGHIRK